MEIEGLEELQRDIRRAAAVAPKEFEAGLTKITNKFKKEVKSEAKTEFQTNDNITSGFKVTKVNAEAEVYYSYFQPEARGNKGHHWHLQEFGYELKRPIWRSREKAIRWKDAKRTLGWVPGRHIVESMLPSFTAYASRQAEELLDSILSEGDF